MGAPARGRQPTIIHSNPTYVRRPDIRTCTYTEGKLRAKCSFNVGDIRARICIRSRDADRDANIRVLRGATGTKPLRVCGAVLLFCQRAHAKLEFKRLSARQGRRARSSPAYANQMGDMYEVGGEGRGRRSLQVLHSLCCGECFVLWGGRRTVVRALCCFFYLLFFKLLVMIWMRRRWAEGVVRLRL